MIKSLFVFLLLLGAAVLLYSMSLMKTSHSWLDSVDQATTGRNLMTKYIRLVLDDLAKNSWETRKAFDDGESQVDARSTPAKEAESHETIKSCPNKAESHKTTKSSRNTAESHETIKSSPNKAESHKTTKSSRNTAESHKTIKSTANEVRHRAAHLDTAEKTSKEKAKSKLTNSSSSAWDELVRAASAIAEKRGLVFFSVLNDAYVDLANSWLCNTAPLGDVHRHVLFLSTDLATGRRLQDAWPNITVVSFNASRFNGPQRYSRGGYVRLMVERTRLIQRLVNSGVRLLLFEVDFVWLADPLPAILAQSRQSLADIVATRSNRRNDMACGCFLLLNPTTATAELWARLTRRMDELDVRVARLGERSRVSTATNDQTFLSALINERYGGVRVAYLPEALFPDGKWYGTAAERRAADEPQPLVIHNNWIAGNAAKIQRAKHFHHWFLTADSTSTNVVCDVAAVRDLVSRRARTA